MLLFIFIVPIPPLLDGLNAPLRQRKRHDWSGGRNSVTAQSVINQQAVPNEAGRTEVTKCDVNSLAPNTWIGGYLPICYTSIPLDPVVDYANVMSEFHKFNCGTIPLSGLRTWFK